MFDFQPCTPPTPVSFLCFSILCFEYQSPPYTFVPPPECVSPNPASGLPSFHHKFFGVDIPGSLMSPRVFFVFSSPFSPFWSSPFMVPSRLGSVLNLPLNHLRNRSVGLVRTPASVGSLRVTRKHNLVALR